MTRLKTIHLLIVALVLVGVSASTGLAQTPESTTQMQLVASSVFTSRLQYLGVQVAKEVLEEIQNGVVAMPVPYTTPCHTQRVELARSWVQSPAQMSSIAAVHVAGTNESGAVIVGTVVDRDADPVATSWDSSASDLALKQALRFKWSAMSRCVTNP